MLYNGILKSKFTLYQAKVILNNLKYQRNLLREQCLENSSDIVLGTESIFPARLPTKTHLSLQLTREKSNQSQAL